MAFFPLRSYMHTHTHSHAHAQKKKTWTWDSFTQEIKFNKGQQWFYWYCNNWLEFTWYPGTEVFRSVLTGFPFIANHWLPLSAPSELYTHAERSYSNRCARPPGEATTPPPPSSPHLPPLLPGDFPPSSSSGEVCHRGSVGDLWSTAVFCAGAAGEEVAKRPAESLFAPPWPQWPSPPDRGCRQRGNPEWSRRRGRKKCPPLYLETGSCCTCGPPVDHRWVEESHCTDCFYPVSDSRPGLIC